MSKEIEILKAAGYENIKLVATYEADDLDMNYSQLKQRVSKGSA